MSVDLKVDFCSHEAAKYAVEHWHYSKAMPTGKSTYVGVWENESFVGATVFSRGGNHLIGKPYNLDVTDVCELTRVALRDHAHPVSKVLSASIKLLKTNNPSLRLVVSYADQNQNHHGGIYQAGNWVYVGVGGATQSWIGPDGKSYHNRSISKNGYVKRDRPNGQMYAKAFKPEECERIALLPKHKYLYPLDKAMRRQIEPLAKPYPKRADVGEIESR